jgi:protein phosphatase
MIPQTGDYTDLGDYGILLVVADGMGGANAGEVASAIAVETIQNMFTPEQVKEAISDDKSIQEFMKDVVKAADLNILKRSQDDSSTRGMGTTIVMAWVLKEKAYVCWCGDSRCYVLNKQHGLIQLSKDHSYVQELVDKGELDPELMHDHPLSNVITRCLGDMEKRANAETRIYQLHHDDCIMLCSDGLSSLYHDCQIFDTMIEFHDNPLDCKNELISAALSNGGYDNVTIAVCNIHHEGEEEDEVVAEPENDGEKELKDAEEDTSNEELNTTIRNIPVRSKRKISRFFLIMFLLLVIAGLCIYLIPDCEPIRNEISATVNQIILKVKHFKS